MNMSLVAFTICSLISGVKDELAAARRGLRAVLECEGGQTVTWGNWRFLIGWRVMLVANGVSIKSM